LTAQGGIDASAYSGVAVETRGRPGSYFIHLRTRTTRLPWQHYKARIPVGPEWQRTIVPFEEFRPDSIRGTLDPSRLTSIAIVAAGERFDGEILIRRVEFVP
jgi:hypothetical protein